MQKNNRLSTVLSVIAIVLSLFVLFTYFRDRTDNANTAPEPLSVTETPAAQSEAPTPEPGGTESEAPPAESVTEAPAESTQAEAAVSEDGHYTSPEDVALYIHLYGHLPSNYITKNEAKDLGWQSVSNDLHDVAPGMSIGGDRFMNYEGLLPDDARYTECDVNYSGGNSRGPERIVFSDDGAVYYTPDHYESFTQMY